MSENIKKHGKLGICQVCKSNEAKYTCPRCESCSCSLSCVRTHKDQNNCNGIRNRTQLLYKEDMDNFTLLSDYRFLEEIDHKLEDGLRNPLRKSILKKKESFQDLPYHLRTLKLEAKKRGTTLEYMPRSFSSHRENSSRYLFTEKKIRWHVKLLFPQADCSFTEESIDENTLLKDILKTYMEPPKRLDDKDSPLSIDDLARLSYYHSASYKRTSVLFKSKMCRFDTRFIEMTLSKSLKDNLKNRKVVEYPEFHVVLKDHLNSYLDMESDSESDNVVEEPLERSDLSQDFKNKLKVRSLRNDDDSQKLSYFEAFSDSSDMSE